jgi:hypothetical protein
VRVLQQRRVARRTQRRIDLRSRENGHGLDQTRRRSVAQDVLSGKKKRRRCGADRRHRQRRAQQEASEGAAVQCRPQIVVDWGAGSWELGGVRSGRRQWWERW